MGDGRKWAAEFDDDVGELSNRVKNNSTANELVVMIRKLNAMENTKPFTKEGFRRLEKIQNYMEDLVGECMPEYPRLSHWGKAGIKDIL